MGFDAAWFDELRQLNANIIKQVPVGQGRFYPDIGDLWYDNSTILHVFTNRFFEEISQLTCQLRQSGIPFHRFFKIASERHIIDFPEHTCCLFQWNIGFSAGAISNHDMVRVGIGFRLNDSLENRSYQSYQDYLARVRRNPTGFNNLFVAPLNYSEPTQLFQTQNKASTVLSDQPNRWDDWRFFGRVFFPSNQADQQILQDTNNFAQAALSVFTQIRAAQFAC